MLPIDVIHFEPFAIFRNLAPGLVLKRYLVDPCIMKNEADVVSQCFCETMLGQLLGRSLNGDIPMELKELSCTAASMELFEPLYKDSKYNFQ